jgi:L-lysine 2,3-aminomutase
MAEVENKINVPDSVVDSNNDIMMVLGTPNMPKVKTQLQEYYNETEITTMTSAGVFERMKFGINPYYNAIVTGVGFTPKDGSPALPVMPASIPVKNLVVPVIAEVQSGLDGDKDPSNQNKYAPEELGQVAIHKYEEIVLGYVAKACSAHCRYCYRLDLFSGKTDKGVVSAEEVRDYIMKFNQAIVDNNGINPKTGKKGYPVREFLLSGGDPMVLTNKKIYRYLAAAAEAGVDTVRIGTKELAFRPMRFDDNFIAMLKIFHENHPNVHVNIVSHFTHADEFLERDANNKYIQPTRSTYKWLDAVREPVKKLQALHFVSIENQTPIIKHINDSVDALHLLHKELRRNNIKPKYIFNCRHIEGYKAFAVPVELGWKMHNEAMKGLSDTAKSRFVMSAENGKLEIVSITDELPKEIADQIRLTRKTRLKPFWVMALLFIRFTALLLRSRRAATLSLQNAILKRFGSMTMKIELSMTADLPDWKNSADWFVSLPAAAQTA